MNTAISIVLAIFHLLLARFERIIRWRIKASLEYLQAAETMAQRNAVRIEAHQAIDFSELVARRACSDQALAITSKRAIFMEFFFGVK